MEISPMDRKVWFTVNSFQRNYTNEDLKHCETDGGIFVINFHDFGDLKPKGGLTHRLYNIGKANSLIEAEYIGLEWANKNPEKPHSCIEISYFPLSKPVKRSEKFD